MSLKEIARFRKELRKNPEKAVEKMTENDIQATGSFGEFKEMYNGLNWDNIPNEKKILINELKLAVDELNSLNDLLKKGVVRPDGLKKSLQLNKKIKRINKELEKFEEVP